MYFFQDPTNPIFREKMKEFMQKFDKNKDGRIEMSEVRPSRCLLYQDWKFDLVVRHLGKYTYLLLCGELRQKFDTTHIYVATAVLDQYKDWKHQAYSEM